jgi:hypothetical protein
MADEFAQSLTLLFSGAGITLVSTVLVDFFRGRREAKLDKARSEKEEANKLRDEGRKHAIAVNDALLDLGEYGTDHRDQLYIKTDEVKHLLLIARRQYLLIPSVEVRTALVDGLWVVVNGESQSVTTEDWSVAALESAFVVSAYLRGEPLQRIYVERLKAMKLKYSGPEVGDQAVG